MKTHLAALLLASFTASALAQGGVLTPPGAPAPTMRSLQEIWDKITTLETMSQSQQNELESLRTENAQLRQQGAASQAQNNILLMNAGVPFSWKTRSNSNLHATGQGFKSSLAFLPDGRPAVATYTNGTFDLKYGVLDGDLWNYVNVDTAGDVGGSCSLAVNLLGRPMIAYSDSTNGSLKVASQTENGAWSAGQVINEPAIGVSLAIHPYTGAPDVSFINSGTLKFGRFILPYAVETVDTGLGAATCTSLAYTPQGNPAISYFNQTSGVLKYAEYDGTTWITTTVDTVPGLWCSLKISPTTGRPSIAYDKSDTKDVKYASFDGTSWNVSTIDSAGDLGEPSLAFNHLGRPHIAYYSGDLKLAAHDGTAWTISVLDTADDAGAAPSLAFGPAALPAVSYRDKTNDAIRFARLLLPNGN